MGVQYRGVEQQPRTLPPTTPSPKPGLAGHEAPWSEPGQEGTPAEGRMLARDNEQPRGPPRMPRRLLGESRELEAAAPPPRGPALPRQGRLLEATHAPAGRLSPGPGPPALPNPEPALRTWPPLSGILPRPPPPPPAPHPQPPRTRPLIRRRQRLADASANRRFSFAALPPIRAGRRRGFSKVIPAPPGAPRSLLFGRARLGLSSRHFREEVPSSDRLESGLVLFPAKVLQLSTSWEPEGQGPWGG